MACNYSVQSRFLVKPAIFDFYLRKIDSSKDQTTSVHVVTSTGNIDASERRHGIVEGAEWQVWAQIERQTARAKVFAIVDGEDSVSNQSSSSSPSRPGKTLSSKSSSRGGRPQTTRRKTMTATMIFFRCC
jgi:hypothetical protein